MGNCGGICTNNISKNKGDIIMEKLMPDKESSNNVLSYNIQKVKFLQKHIKIFLKRKKKQKQTASTSKKTTKSKNGKINQEKENQKEKNNKNNDDRKETNL